MGPQFLLRSKYWLLREIHVQTCNYVALHRVWQYGIKSPSLFPALVDFSLQLRRGRHNSFLGRVYTTRVILLLQLWLLQMMAMGHGGRSRSLFRAHVVGLLISDVVLGGQPPQLAAVASPPQRRHRLSQKIRGGRQGMVAEGSTTYVLLQVSSGSAEFAGGVRMTD